MSNTFRIRRKCSDYSPV